MTPTCAGTRTGAISTDYVGKEIPKPYPLNHFPLQKSKINPTNQPKSQDGGKVLLQNVTLTFHINRSSFYSVLVL